MNGQRPEPDLLGSVDKYRCDSCGGTVTGNSLTKIKIRSGYRDEDDQPIMEVVNGSPCCHDTVTKI